MCFTFSDERPRILLRSNRGKRVDGDVWLGPYPKEIIEGIVPILQRLFLLGDDAVAGSSRRGGVGGEEKEEEGIQERGVSEEKEEEKKDEGKKKMRKKQKAADKGGSKKRDPAWRVASDQASAARLALSILQGSDLQVGAREYMAACKARYGGLAIKVHAAALSDGAARGERRVKAMRDLMVVARCTLDHKPSCALDQRPSKPSTVLCWVLDDKPSNVLGVPCDKDAFGKALNPEQPQPPNV